LRMEKIYAPLVLLVCLLLACSLPSEAAAGSSEALSYISGNQRDDGGFAEPGRGPGGADGTTAWCVMALSAAGVDPRNVKRNGKSPLDFLAGQSSNWRSVTDYERTLLAAAAAGENLRSFGGVDLVAKVQSYQGPGGNIGDAVNSNAFGMMAYRAAGMAVPPGAVQWHRATQNPDGGWGNNPGGASNPDMTAASIMALRAAGVDAGDPSLQAALSYLRSIQNGDGGFSFQPGASDVAATAWCVQAIVAAGQDPAGAEWSRNGNTPYGFVASMQAQDGHFYWMEGWDKNPVWTTAYALCALARKPYPVGVSCADPSAGQSDGDAVEQIPGEPPYPSPNDDQAGGEAEGGHEQAAGDESAEPGQETGTGEGGDVVRTQEGETAKTENTSGKSKEGVEEDGGGSGGNPLLWLIPLLAALPLLALGGWYIFRRYATK